MLTLITPLDRITGIGPRFLTKFKKLGIETVGDLLYHFPSRYEDFSEVYRIADLEPGQQATVRGTIDEIESHRTWRRHMTVVTATISDESGTVRATWFNQPYIKNVLKAGTLANFSGKVALSDSDHELYLSHPTYERVGGLNQPTRHTARLVPVYPETSGLTSKGIRFILQPILEHLTASPEWIPPEILSTYNLPNLDSAFDSIHFPETLEEALQAKRRFAFEDLFLLQFVNVREKSKLAARTAPRLPADIDAIKETLKQLPFPLTFSQKKSLWEIIKDLEKPHPMNRLLQGDVGSGKTVVAALAALIAARNGYQAAFMAPTEVLAKQHYETLKKLFGKDSSLSIPAVALLTSSTAKVFYEADMEHESKKDLVRDAIKRGEIKIVVGTHALISEERAGKRTKKKAVQFKKLGLAIVDEQHRFGVEQRAKLVHERTARTVLPHFLSMSATPIPRTLMLTLFGDLDISTITELPVGRKEITTSIVSPQDRARTYEFIRQQIHEGRQAFVICPRISASEAPINGEETNPNFEVKSVEEEYKKLSHEIFPEFKIGMLHGQMKAQEKENVMTEFRSGVIHILVATSVIEVGVDIPNASVMMIEGSDRFGLAQLYQFRGRVGRGEHQSFCFLFTEIDAKVSSKRLKAIIDAKNGFELAEKDLELRGPGEFLGQKQTGIPDYAMRGIQNVQFIKDSRAAAVHVLRNDPFLEKNSLLKEKVIALEKRLHLE